MKLSFLSALVALFLIGCGGQSSASGDADQYFSTGGDFAGSHILIQYQGSERADPSITRTKEEAEEKARALIAQLQEDPSVFEELARQESDGPSGPNGGSLGSWSKGQMVPEFDVAIENMMVGTINTEPVETPFGYHVIRRDPTEALHYAAQAFIVSWSGNPQFPQVQRTREEADALVAQLGGQLTAENFESLADENNDAGDQGAFMIGPYTEGQTVPEEIVNAVKGMSYGDVGGPVEVPIGYVFLKRVKVEQYAGSHILIGYQGAERADPSIVRSKDEARSRAMDLIEQLQSNPGQFDALARENSDGPSSQSGGDLGVWFKGKMVPEFDVAIQDMEIGEISSEPVETLFGYHIIRRNALPE